MIELYLDTVDVEQVRRLNMCLPLKGVTTNPSILAKASVGVNQALSAIAEIIGSESRFHVQVVSQTVDEIVAEAIQIDALPYDMIVKIPATEVGLTAIKQIKQKKIKVLATAIYSTQQGFMAALCGADYLAPYVNRMDTFGSDGVAVVADLQLLLTHYGLDCLVLPASFKNTKQVMDVMKLGVGAITLPVDIAMQMVKHPAVESAVNKFNQDWQSVFGAKLSFES
ncbi:MAG: fructose-6-phosphate aldolase [Methylococcaceae bacterium]|nr:fructose-6-phosphate aldolase [Methylococcaceae bacterium]